ncbi:MAG: hypothetical protein ACI3YD_02000 [Alloprevotella sp.]
MKRTYILYCLVIISSCLLCGCKSSQKLSVEGVPGTTIYTPFMTKVGVVENNGKARIVLPRDGYYAYLLSQQSGSDQLVPFALNYRHKKYTGTYALRNLGYFITAASVVPLLSGVIATAAGDEDPGTPLMSGGTAGMLVGTAIGWPADCRSQQTQYAHKFKYLSSQATNHDINFMPVVDEGFRRSSFVNKPEISMSAHPLDTPESATSSAKRKSSASTRTFKDYGKATAGSYAGYGSLLKNDDVIEKYNDVEIHIQRIDNNTVTVEVVVEGESFFNTKAEYTIIKTKTGYQLTLQGIPSATIDIDSQGKLTYYHPKVNIDSDIYILRITARNNSAQ